MHEKIMKHAKRYHKYDKHDSLLFINKHKRNYMARNWLAFQHFIDIQKRLNI